MKKNILLLLICVTSTTMFAQSIVEDLSSSTAVAVRDPARQASTEVDAALYNPAGTALIDEGFHLSLSGVGNMSTTKATGGLKDYKIEENYILPSFQAVYKKGDWAFSGSFASEGGFASRNYKEGSPAYDYLNNQSFIGFLKDYALTSMAQSFQAFSILGGPNVNINSNDQLRYYYSNMKSHLYNNAIRFGVAHKISQNMSAYVGLKVCNISWKYDVNPTVNVYKNISQTEVSLADYIADAKKRLTGTDGEKEVYAGMLDRFEEMINIGIGSNQLQSGWGVSPVFGLDYKTEKLNFGAKYDFGTHVNVGDGKCVGLPSHLSLGGSWQTTDKFKIAAGGDVYFKSECTPLIAYDDKVLWDAAISATLKLTDALMINAGYQIGANDAGSEDYYYIYAGQEGMNYGLSSLISAGLRYAFTDKLSVDLGLSVIPTSTVESEFNLLAGSTTHVIEYKRTPVRVGVGLNYNF